MSTILKAAKSGAPMGSVHSLPSRLLKKRYSSVQSLYERQKTIIRSTADRNLRTSSTNGAKVSSIIHVEDFLWTVYLIFGLLGSCTKVTGLVIPKVRHMLRLDFLVAVAVRAMTGTLLSSKLRISPNSENSFRNDSPLHKKVRIMS